MFIPTRLEASEGPRGHDLDDAGYQHLAFQFNGDDLNAERCAARDSYAHRREDPAREVSGRSDAQDARAEIDVAWPIEATDLRESLLEAEADRRAGRTVGAEETRARYGLPPLGTG